MKSQGWWLSATLLALGCLVTRTSAAGAADEHAAGGKEARRTNLRGWSFLWKTDTIEKKVGEKLNKEQEQKVNAARDEIKKKYRQEIDGENRVEAGKASVEATEAYRAALKGILTPAQFDALFAEKTRKTEKKTEKKEM